MREEREREEQIIRESRESSDEDIARRYGKEAYRNRRLETESLKVRKSTNINCTWLNIQQEYKYFKHLPWVSMLLKTFFCGPEHGLPYGLASSYTQCDQEESRYHDTSERITYDRPADGHDLWILLSNLRLTPPSR